jgi:phospholipid/cholesterol/gamma-HCH transport system substrate-binding protein
MSRGRRASPALIGVFVLGAAALAATVAVVWGSGRFFRKTMSFVCYFSGSVNGLIAGAPVKFRGVPIGSVTDMRFRLAQATGANAEDFRIPVWFQIDLQQLSELRGGGAVRIDRQRLDELIAQGLRAQLQTESFVTGVLYVGLDFFPGSPVVLANGDRPDILEVPTMPTALERASQTLTKLLARIEKLDVEGLVHSIKNAVDGFNVLVRSPEFDRTLVAAREALGSIQQLSDSVKPGVQPMMTSLGATSAGARASLQRLDATLADLRSLIDTQGPLTVELTQTLIDLGDAAESVRDLASYLDRKPNALITGRPGS